MCGRFTLSTVDERAIEEELGVLRGSLPSTSRPRFNIAPTDEHFIVRQRYEDREVVPAKFGLINDPLLVLRCTVANTRWQTNWPQTSRAMQRPHRHPYFALTPFQV